MPCEAGAVLGNLSVQYWFLLDSAKLLGTRDAVLTTTEAGYRRSGPRNSAF